MIGLNKQDEANDWFKQTGFRLMIGLIKQVTFRR